MIFRNLNRNSESFLSEAMAINTQGIGNLHDPEIRNLLGKREVIVYHGTSSKKLAKILQHGSLDPSFIADNPDIKSYENASPGIYVTKQSTGVSGAELYANKAIQSGGDAVILELQIPANWIDLDPDDLKFFNEDLSEDTNEKLKAKNYKDLSPEALKKINQYGKYQGVVSRPISIKRIREVKIYSSEIAGFSEGRSERETNWLPLGKMLDVIARGVKKDVIHSEEYLEMVSQRPPRLSRSQSFSDIEEVYATKFQCFHDNFFGNPQDIYHGRDSYDNALIWFLRNKKALYQPATKAAAEFLEYLDPSLGVTFENFGDKFGEEYQPRKHENFRQYLDRVG